MPFNILILIFYFLLGTAVGSFLNVWSRRLLRGEPPTGRSQCEHCKHILSAADLIPLLSFFVLRGRCRYCKKSLSWQYPLVEAGTGLLFAALVFRLDLLAASYSLLATIPLLMASSALITIFITDFSARQISDQAILVGVISALFYRILVRFNPAGSGFQLVGLVYDFLGAGSVFVFFQLIRRVTKKRGLGEGDPPLGFFTALLVGAPQVLVQVFFTFVIGGAVGVALILLGKKRLKDRIAFGPFLVSAAFVTLLFGERLLNWYLGYLGF